VGLALTATNAPEQSMLAVEVLFLPRARLVVLDGDLASNRRAPDPSQIGVLLRVKQRLAGLIEELKMT